MRSEEGIQTKAGAMPALILAAEQGVLPVMDGNTGRSAWNKRAFQSPGLVASAQPWYTGRFV